MAKKPDYGFGAKKPSGFSVFMGRLKKGFLVSAFAGAAVGPVAYYKYGTIKDAEIKIDRWENLYEDKDGENVWVGNVFHTDKGVFRNAPSRMHLKDMEDARKIYQQVATGETYRIKSYGNNAFFGFAPWEPNIFKFTRISEDELEGRRKMEEDRKKSAAGQPQQPQPGQPAGEPAPVQLSGRTTVIEIVSGGQRVQLTVPVEAVRNGESLVVVNRVTPVQTFTVVQPPAPQP